MANLLTITKKPVGYFDFVVNGDVANIVTNAQNAMLGYKEFCHFKTSDGANIIKEQNITFSNITLIDGMTTLPQAVSMDDLILKLESIGFFDWQTSGGGGGGVNRFDELLDTFPYFGKDGQVPVVDEAQLRLIAQALPDVSYLSYFPTPLVQNKALRVNNAGTAYEFYDPVNLVTQEIRETATETAPSEAAVFAALQSISFGGLSEQLDFDANGVDNFIDIGTTAVVKSWLYGSVLQVKNDWSQTGSVITFTFIPEAGTKNLSFI